MDIKTSYMGMPLNSPFIVAASPISAEIDNIKLAEDSGASAIVLYSLFEEQIRQEQKDLFYKAHDGDYISAEVKSFFPEPVEFKVGPEGYLELIRKAKEAVKIPIIASLNGTTVGGWTEYAEKMQQAGADAIELNQYNIPTQFGFSSEKIEETYLEVLRVVKNSVRIPIAVKLSPFFTNIANLSRRLDDEGADALVLFNRFYQPDIDLENLEVKPHIEFSSSFSNRLPLTWIAILKGRIAADISATTGIHTAKDVIKMLLAGANAVQLCSVLLKNGVEHIKVIQRDMLKWMEEKEYNSVHQMIGAISQRKLKDPAAYERIQYMKTISSYKY